MKYKIVISCGLFFISLLIAGTSNKSSSQTGLLMSVYGCVNNINSGEPIPNVTVSIVELTSQDDFINVSSGISDKNGFYKVKYLKEGIYHFSIDIPEKGTVYMGYISSGASSNDYYKLEIKYGENKNLNIFLGESNESDILRNESSDGRRIDLTMILDEELFLSQTLSKNNSLTNTSESREEYKGMTIIQKQDIEIVGDNVAIAGNPNMEARYWYKLIDNVIPTYQERTCKFEKPQGKFIGKIQMHSFEWLKNKINKKRQENNLPPLGDECIRCRYDCLIIHERTHMEKASPIVKSRWDEALGRLEKPMSADCPDECKKWGTYVLNRFEQGLKDSIAGTEIAAQSKQDECEQSKCKDICGDRY